jgi:hypothetical protein
MPSILQNEDFRRGCAVTAGVLVTIYLFGLAAGLFRRIV